MTKLFPFVHIRDVNLHDWSSHGTDGILQSDGSMSVGTCIQHYTVVRKAYFMNFVNQFPLYIRLVICELNRRIVFFNFSR